MSMRSVIAGALGATTAAGDLVAPGLSPLVDLGVGAAVAWLAYDGVREVAEEAGLDLDKRELAAAALAEVGETGTVAARLLHLYCKGPSQTDALSAGWRAAWRHLLGAGLAKLAPGVATVVNVANATKVAARNAALVATIEERAAAICASVTPLRRSARKTPAIAATIAA
jgi:hypothetical protein